MEVRRSVNTKIWGDEWFENLKPNDKLLWVYLITNSHTNMLGIYEITLKRISFETGLILSEIEKSLKSFERVRKAYFELNFIILPNWIKNQSMNTNMIKSASNLYSILSNEMKTKLLNYGFESFEILSKGYSTLPNRAIPKNEYEDEREIEDEVPKKFIPPTQTQVINYFLENGYKESAAKKAFQFYNDSNWIDSKDKKVKRWKQKMLSVWFTDENKVLEFKNETDLERALRMRFENEGIPITAPHNFNK